MSAPDREAKITAVSLIALFMLTLSAYETAQSQDFNNPCFYCHMNIIVEMKSAAPQHWSSDVQCSACHGTSGEHVDAEDNSAKPDSVWTDMNVHNLCGSCHDEILDIYEQSGHAKFALGTVERDTIGATCVTCHGAHGLAAKTAIDTVCTRCHAALAQSCQPNQQHDAACAAQKACSVCHNAHSATLTEATIRKTNGNDCEKKEQE